MCGIYNVVKNSNSIVISGFIAESHILAKSISINKYVEPIEILADVLIGENENDISEWHYFPTQIFDIQPDNIVTYITRSDTILDYTAIYNHNEIISLFDDFRDVIVRKIKV